MELDSTVETHHIYHAQCCSSGPIYADVEEHYPYSSIGGADEAKNGNPLIKELGRQNQL